MNQEITPRRKTKHKAAGRLMVTALFLASLNLRPAISSISPVIGRIHYWRAWPNSQWLDQ